MEKHRGRHSFLAFIGTLLTLSALSFLPSCGGGGGGGSGTSNAGTDDSGSGKPGLPDFDGWDTPADWLLTPSSIQEVASGQIQGSSEPLLDCLGMDKAPSGNRPSMFTRGQTIELAPGNYPHFRGALSYDLLPGHTKANTATDIQFGLDPITVVRAQVPGTVFIDPNPVGGSQTHYIQWVGAMSFYGITFVGDDTAAILSENAGTYGSFHQGFRDIWFFDCAIDGGYNFETDSGPDNKWAILNYNMGQSAYNGPGWIWRGGSITGIHKEHANYFHNIQGDILIEGNSDTDPLIIKWCGRTAFQMRNTQNEGAPGVGNLTFRNISVEDVNLQPSGGGSAFSFNGRHTGTILLDKVTVRLGANPNLHPNVSGNITGGLVVFAGDDTAGLPNGDVVLDSCDFQVGPSFTGSGSARRANIQVDECQSFTMRNTRVAQLGNNPREAIALSMGLIQGSVTFENNTVIGRCIVNGTNFDDLQSNGTGYKNMLLYLMSNFPSRVVVNESSLGLTFP